ncbi:unnamed protein product [Peronospora belbahrii]|uniref:tRNA ligase phosphodiesterase domain-containing protein n=1 Tax=Peronospora belbahrii TaxID=622444 RepID=A0ABN8DAT9_9STRA|nr:unnamed protein product [Peronospora belbahrii]
MARHKSHYNNTHSRPSRAFSSTNRGRYRRSSDDQDQTEESAVRVNVTLEFRAETEVSEPLYDVVKEFEQCYKARRNHALTKHYDVRVKLLECGLNKWQDVVKLQRILAALKRPMDGKKHVQLMAKTLLRHNAKCNEWMLSLDFMRESMDALCRFENALMLRLKSCGVTSKVLLPTNHLILSLLSVFGDCGTMKSDKHQWNGKLVSSQVVLAVAGEQRDELQRVFFPPIREVATAAQAIIEELRYPGLVKYMDGILSSSADSEKAVVIILRGIPGSGKTTIRREIQAICSHKKVMLTTCSADSFFETQRGYLYDVRKIGAAHSKCKADFTGAVEKELSRSSEDGCLQQHVVLVDNSNTQRWEYEAYEDIAKIQGCRVHIIEMKCPDVLTAFRMSQRNSHGVPSDKVISMFQRWEKDQRAHCFAPQFEHPTLFVNPLSDDDVEGFTYLGLFLDAVVQEQLTARLPPVHANKFADHVTLFYRPNKQYARFAELGAPYTVRGVEVVQDERGQALWVELDEQLPLQVKNKIPHITLSTKGGVRPTYSNDLLTSSTAKRTVIDPPIDLTARVGAAFYIQNQQVNVTTSPFAVDTAPEDINHFRPPNDSGVGAKTNTPTSSELFIMYVRECDLADDAEEATTKLLKRAQILHQMGFEHKVRRILCLQKTQASPWVSISALLSKVQAQYRFASAHIFDDVVVIPHPFSFEGFEEVINNYLEVAHLGPTKKLTMLTTVEESMRWPLCEMNHFQDAAVSVFRTDVGFGSGATHYNTALKPPSSTLLSSLDLLSINVEEQTRSVIFHGINTVGDAWARVLEVKANHSLQRIDMTVPGLSSSVVDLCLVLPDGTSLSEVSTLRMKLLNELNCDQRVRHAVGGSNFPGLLYFSLCTASSHTPAFCVRMTIRSMECGSGVDTNTVAQLEFCELQSRMSRALFDIESYSVLTALLRAILLSRCSCFLPSKCQLSSLINLTSERLILQCFSSNDSFGGVDAMPTAADVMSGHIIFTLYRMLTQLSKLNSDEWAAAFGTSLQALQGNEDAQTVWIQAMEKIVRDCAVVMASYRCVGEGLKKTSPLDPTDHFQVLVALIKAEVDGTPGASFVRASVEVSSHLDWSHVHSLALCDKLRHAATMVTVRQENDVHNTDSPAFFSCAPSLVARRIDVAASSLDGLRNVMAEIDALNVCEDDDESGFSGDYKYGI